MENVSSLAIKSEQIRQKLVKLVRTYAKSPLLGNLENWPVVNLIGLVIDPGVCGLTLSDACLMLRKSLAPAVCQPEISELNKELRSVYALCYSMFLRVAEEGLFGPAEVIFNQTEEALRKNSERLLIVAHVEKELFFEAWYESAKAEAYEAIYWNKEQLFLMRTVKSLDNLNDDLGRKCYEEASAVVLETCDTPQPLMIVLSGIPEVFEDEITHCGD